MTTTQRRLAAAVSLGLSAALALSTGAAPAQAGASAAARAATSDQLTVFGYRGDVYGVKLVTDSVEALNLKDAHAQQLCTRSAGKVVEQQSVVSVPDNPLIRVSASTSRTQKYADGETHGVRGTNTIGDIAVGGTVGPLTTPRLVIKGLQTTARAFHTPRGYGHDEGFTFASISLELLDNTVVQQLPPELRGAAPLDQVTDTVFTGTQQVAQQVFQVLSDVTKPIVIPGLGTIALGYENGRANSHNAQSQASALRIEVTAGDRRQLVELGTARVRMGGPAPRRRLPLGRHGDGLPGAPGCADVRQRRAQGAPLPGHPRPDADLPGPPRRPVVPVPVLLEGVTYQVNGDQFRAKAGAKRGKVAKGWSRTTIGSVSIPTAQLVITDVSSRAAMRQKAGKRVGSQGLDRRRVHHRRRAAGAGPRTG